MFYPFKLYQLELQLELKNFFYCIILPIFTLGLIFKDKNSLNRKERGHYSYGEENKKKQKKKKEERRELEYLSIGFVL